MRTIFGNGINYEVTGEREEEAAAMLDEGLNAVSKRRNAYIDDNVEVRRRRQGSAQALSLSNMGIAGARGGSPVLF